MQLNVYKFYDGIYDASFMFSDS